MEQGKKPLLGPYNGYSQLLILLGILLVSEVLFSILGLTLAKVFFHIDLMKETNLMNKLDKVPVMDSLKLVQVFNALGLFILPPFLLAFLFTWKVGPYLYLRHKASTISFLLTILIMFAAIPLINWMGSLNALMKLPEALSGIERWMKNAEEAGAKVTKAFLDMHSISELLVNFFIVALLPAFGEELLFRGALFRILKRLTQNGHAAIWISAILFSAMHMQFYGFLPRLMMGVFFGYLVLWSGSLWLPVTAHLTNNGAAVLMAYCNNKDILKINADKIGTENNSALIVVSSILVVTVIAFNIRRKERRRPGHMSMLNPVEQFI
jgi:membrane protease YdiL (CAAX protease family)